MKHLITSGCSFTHDVPTWANFLSETTGRKLHNVAMSGAGNHIISSELIRKIEILLDEGIKEEDMVVVVQWSGIFRFDKIVEKHPNTSDRLVYLANGQQPRAFSPPSGTYNDWVMCAGSRDKGIWPSVHTIMSKEQAFLETVENVLRVQWYLNHQNIKFKMFTGWDIFTDGAPIRKGTRLGTDTIVNTNQFTDDSYTNKTHTMLSDNCKWFGYLFDMIDWDNFWTFEDENIKYGGLTQWAKSTLPKDEWYRAPGDFHPSTEAHKKFANQVLMEIIND